MRRGTLGQTNPPGPKNATAATGHDAPPTKQQPTNVEAAKPANSAPTEEERVAEQAAQRRVDYLLGRNSPIEDPSKPTPSDVLWADFLWRNEP